VVGVAEGVAVRAIVGVPDGVAVALGVGVAVGGVPVTVGVGVAVGAVPLVSCTTPVDPSVEINLIEIAPDV
jgi:hypothetical protein